MQDKLIEIAEKIRQGQVMDAYVIWRDKDGQDYDKVYGYQLVELVGVLECAKHMQLQNFTQEQLTGEAFEQDPNEIARKLHTVLHGLFPGPTEKTWADLSASEREKWIAAVHTSLQA